MKKQEFRITIDASPERVWDVLLGDDTYPQWTSVFCEGSRAETDWKKGSKVLFLGEDGSGMVSEVAENIPYQYISFRHLGEVKNGVEDTESEKVKQWAGATENYTLKPADGKTEWIVDIDISEEFGDFMLQTWPAALQKVKQLAEQN